MDRNNQKIKYRAILLSLIVSFLLMSLKFWAYWQTKSYVILTDACESIVNVVASAFAFYSIYLVTLPKDHNHPYGHGKVEFFSVGFEGAMILIAGLFTIFPAIISIFRPHQLENLGSGIILIAITIFFNALLGFYLKNLGEKNDSLILLADGTHLLSDAIANCVLIIGLFVIKYTTIPYLDSILSLILSIFLIRSGYKLVRNSIAGLMDETDLKVVEKLSNFLNTNRHTTWIDVHNFRVQRYGSDLHIDCHLTLPYYLSLEEAHNEVSAFEKLIKNQNDSEVEIFTHTDPCLSECCSYCQIKNCTVRKSPFNAKIEWTSARLGVNLKHFDTIGQNSIRKNHF